MQGLPDKVIERILAGTPLGPRGQTGGHRIRRAVPRFRRGELHHRPDDLHLRRPQPRCDVDVKQL